MYPANTTSSAVLYRIRFIMLFTQIIHKEQTQNFLKILIWQCSTLNSTVGLYGSWQTGPVTEWAGRKSYDHRRERQEVAELEGRPQQEQWRGCTANKPQCRSRLGLVEHTLLSLKVHSLKVGSLIPVCILYQCVSYTSVHFLVLMITLWLCQLLSLREAEWRANRNSIILCNLSVSLKFL